jgi:hypothetical protein
MSVNTQTFDNPLTSAALDMGKISRDRELLTSTIDTGSVKRMLVHIGNINCSVLASTRDHVNASKRLNDFALTLARIARNSEPPNQELAVRMTSIAENLRSASQELAGANSIPNWPAPVADIN